jgi:hypothetical protein
MAAATKYQCILYLFNLFLMGIGACLIWYGVETVGPDWNVLVENLVSAHLWPLSITAGTGEARCSFFCSLMIALPYMTF